VEGAAFCLAKVAKSMSDTPDRVIDLELAAKLEAGERVWLKRHWMNIPAPTLLTLIVLVLVVTARSSLYGQGPGSFCLLACFSLSAAWLWWRALASRLQFTKTAVDATDQNLGLSQHPIQLGDVVAAWIAPIREIRIGRRAFKDANCVYVCELTPGQHRASRWVALWITPYDIKANTLLAELRRRCDLNEISPASEDYRPLFEQRPTIWQRPGLDPNVLPAPRWRKPLDPA
jgi:hypothetical protein